MSVCGNKWCHRILWLFCLVLLIVGACFISLRQGLFDGMVLPNMVLVPGTALYPKWKDFPLPVITSVYFFNVTNSKDFMDHGAKPILEEVGPYVFEEWHHKDKISETQANFTTTYQQYRVWYFLPDQSNGTLDDVIHTLNPPAATLNAVAKTLSAFIRGTINIFLLSIGEKLFVSKTARQLLFQGYKDPILTDTAILPSSLVPVKMDKFGYYYPRNGSDWFDGVFNMYTGQDDISKMGKIANWNYTSQVPFFPGECGKVYGAGDFPSPGQTRTKLEMFSNDLCRTLVANYVEDGKYDGIDVFTYKIDRSFFANSVENPANECFNPKNHEQPSGVFNVSSCRFGAPIMMSQPHFFQADPVFLSKVEGLKPDAAKHETFFQVEPNTGTPVNLAARFQVNFFMDPIKEIKMFKNIPSNTYFPTVWMDSSAKIEGSAAVQIWLASNFKNIFVGFGVLMVACSLSYLIGFVVLVLYKKYGVAPVDSPSDPDNSDQAHMIPNEEGPASQQSPLQMGNQVDQQPNSD